MGWVSFSGEENRRGTYKSELCLVGKACQLGSTEQQVRGSNWYDARGRCSHNNIANHTGMICGHSVCMTHVDCTGTIHGTLIAFS